MLTQKKLLAIKNAVSVFDLLDQEKQPKVVFTTQRDNRVDDKICLQLAGIAFKIDDPLRPIIPDDTHPNCRCYYVDQLTGQVVTDISSKRDVKKRDELTDRQRKFLEVLFDKANGDPVQAKLLAGYSEHSATSAIVASMKDEIMEETQLYMSRNAPKAAVAMVSGIDDPTQLGIRDKLGASKELLDRVGLIKTEKVQVEASGGVMLLPPKKK